MLGGRSSRRFDEAGGEEIARPELSAGDPREKVDARRERVQALKAELARDVPVDRAGRTDEEHARRLLAEMLEWHWREQKSATDVHLQTQT